MNELDVIIEARRRERARDDAMTDIICIGMSLLLYGIVRLIGLL